MSDKKAWENGKPILDRLPGFLGKYSRNPVAEYLTAYFDDFLINLKVTLDNLENWLKVDETPENWLDFLGFLSGYSGEYWGDLSPETKRILIKNTHLIWSNKGSIEAFSTVLTAYGIENVVTNDTAFIIGSSVVGDLIADQNWRFIIYINPRQENISRLRRIIPNLARLHTPLWCTYRIIEDYTKFSNPTGITVASQNLLYTGEGTIQDARSADEKGIELGVSFITQEYQDALINFGDDLFWAELDNKLTTKLIERNFIDFTEHLLLFLGDNFDDKLTPLIGTPVSSSSAGSATNDSTTDGLRTGNGTFLEWSETVNDLTSVIIQFFSLDISVGHTNTLFETDRTRLEIYKSNADTLVIKVSDDTGVITETFEMRYVFDTLSANIVYRFDRGSNDVNIYYNEDEIISYSLASQSYTQLRLASDLTAANSFLGNMGYLLITNGLTLAETFTYNRLIQNYLSDIEYPIELSNTLYPPDLIVYSSDIEEVGSSINISDMDALFSLVETLKTVGSYENVNYIMPILGNSFEGSKVALYNRKNEPNKRNFVYTNFDGSEYQTLNGFVFPEYNNKTIDLDEEISSGLLASKNYCHMMGIKLSSLNWTHTLDWIFGAYQASLGYGIKVIDEPLRPFGIWVNSTSEILESVQYTSVEKILTLKTNFQDLSWSYYKNQDKVGEGVFTVNNMPNTPLQIGDIMGDSGDQSYFRLRFFASFESLSDSVYAATYNAFLRFLTDINRV